MSQRRFSHLAILNTECTHVQGLSARFGYVFRISAVRRSCRSSAGAPAVFPTPEPNFVCRSRTELRFPSSGKMTRKQYEMRQMSNDC